MERSFTLLVILLSFRVCFSDDQILQMPGLKKSLNFRQFSGDFTVGKGRYLRYWFIESQSKPSTDPIILWLNGGPGCSSLIGLFAENGPFRIQSDGKTVIMNKKSWNQNNNVLYLETPAGVGYSKDTNSEPISDNKTADDNYSALIAFFERYPQYSNNSFYMFGEDYPIYVVLLALKILEQNSNIKLKGLAIGNGVSDYNILNNTRVFYAYTHGLIDTLEWNAFLKNCCKCSPSRDIKDLSCNLNEPKCNISQTLRNIVTNGINVYNIYKNCTSLGLSSVSPYYMSLKRTFGFIDQEVDNLAQTFSALPKCIDYDAIKKWLNSEEVRKILNIAFPENLLEWNHCSKTVFDKYQIQYTNIRALVIDLVKKYKFKNIIIYNGDLDLVYDFIGNQLFVDKLCFKLIDKYKKWSVDGRTLGFVKRYDGITFITVHNAGHMVPSDQPEAALAIQEMIK